jgi:4-diphosphocytidyl-2-C-methyl-D-erythritol kinase
MSGKGERVVPLDVPLPGLDAVLVNPLAPVPANKTAEVFRRLGAPAIAASTATAVARPAIPDRTELLSLMSRCGNDLDVPAQVVVPEIAMVIEALELLPAIELIQLSGGGPTCFAVFASGQAAEHGAAKLRAQHPTWWIEKTTLG